MRSCTLNTLSEYNMMQMDYRVSLLHDLGTTPPSPAPPRWRRPRHSHPGSHGGPAAR
ncbi:MAG: hypothetical protein HWN65_14210 [Candidatus Helarchaeota archaeon]|nr:hypothetical protein [Candidatus Helarchaeota archaeon]